YRFSFRASSAGPLSPRVVAKVGQQDFPYASAVQAPIPLQAQPQTFALDFEPSRADAKSGVAFVVSAPRGDGQNEVCFDDIALNGSAPP
ncbi:MAG TPA: hypothetical protein VMG12_20360, partial [Polyangiaceae bacterium]|nr:hypothetical protein [Polyangiaceae bacterium]